MAKSVLLYGPPASGKTRYAARIAQRLGLTHVVELDRQERRPQRDGRAASALFITNNEAGSRELAKTLRADRLHIDVALQAIDVDPKEVARG